LCWDFQGTPLAVRFANPVPNLIDWDKKTNYRDDRCLQKRCCSFKRKRDEMTVGVRRKADENLPLQGKPGTP
jgi:hypothetical protein